MQHTRAPGESHVRHSVAMEPSELDTVLDSRLMLSSRLSIVLAAKPQYLYRIRVQSAVHL